MASTLRKAAATSDPRFDVTRKHIQADGRIKVSGGKGLRGTQAYPALFGLNVALCHLEYKHGKHADAMPESDSDDDTASSSDESFLALEISFDRRGISISARRSRSL